MLRHGLRRVRPPGTGSPVGYRFDVSLSSRGWINPLSRWSAPCCTRCGIAGSKSGIASGPSPIVIELAETDATVKTSMMEARFLAGSADLFQDFHRKYFRKVISKNTDAYLDQKLEERRREYEKFGETVYLLEPNVKKEQGRTSRSPFAPMGRDGPFSSADDPRAF